MHGIVFNQLEKFFKENHGREVLEQLKEEAGVRGKIYLPSKASPDSEMDGIMQAATRILGIDKEVLLERFGRYIAPSLLRTYRSYIKKEWGCMDLIEHVEGTIHKAVRISVPESDPPQLMVVRESNDRIVINYTSNRKMVDFGIGIIHALAEHYNETVSIERLSIPNGTSLIVRCSK